MTQAAICNIDNCGVIAVGRCHQCNKAFCSSHQGYIVVGGRYPEGTLLNNECLVCTKTKEHLKNFSQTLNTAYVPALIKRIEYVAKMMSDAHIPGLLPRKKKIGVETKKGGFFKKYEYINIWEDIEPGWFIGIYEWDGGYRGTGLSSEYKVKGPQPIGITASGKIVVMGDKEDHGVEEMTHIDFRPPDEYGNYDRDRLEYAGQTIDEIRDKLEAIAKENNIKLTPWHWPPPEYMKDEVPFGKIYEGVVFSILPFGVNVEYSPGFFGLIHESKIKMTKDQTISEFMQVGQKVKVKVELPDESGNLMLTLI